MALWKWFVVILVYSEWNFAKNYCEIDKIVSVCEWILDMFSMLVHSCFVDDGNGKEKKPLIDEYGFVHLIQTLEMCISHTSFVYLSAIFSKNLYFHVHFKFLKKLTFSLLFFAKTRRKFMMIDADLYWYDACAFIRKSRNQIRFFSVSWRFPGTFITSLSMFSISDFSISMAVDLVFF